jgi:hypothetical protein
VKIQTIAIMSFLALAGCATTCPTPVVNVPHNITIPNVQPQPMNLQHVPWKVYTPDQLNALIATLKTQGMTNVTFYVLDQNGFNALAYNLTDMQRYIKDQKAQNDYLIQAIEINNGTAQAPKPEDKPIVTNPQANSATPK